MVTGLQATRRADAVELQFSVPDETTDGLPYRGHAVHAAVCRAVASTACLPVGSLRDVTLPVGGPAGTQASLRDVLPPELTAGPARLLTYRVQLSNDRGRTAGYGDAAFSAAGAAPDGVAGLRAEGSRQGIAVRWAPGRPGAGAVVLRRELVGGPAGSAATAKSRQARTGSDAGTGKKAKRDEEPVVWLSTSPRPDPLDGAARETAPVRVANGVLDDGAAMGDTYRYSAERQLTVQTGGHAVVLHSALSPPVEVALRAVYPPPPPTDLVGTLFPLPTDEKGKGGGFAVDLIWTPADDAKTVGYNVERTVITPGHSGESSPTKLNTTLVKTPSFHDVLPADLAAVADSVVFQYYVTAVDADGLESDFAAVVVGK